MEKDGKAGKPTGEQTAEGERMKVLLLKEPRESESGADPYIKELAACGHSATLIPVLAFQFVSLDVLTDRLYERMLVEALGLKPLGEHTGTADVLSRLIIEREISTSLPLFFPCGSLKREVLPTTLRQHGVPLETLTVYETAEHPELEKNIMHYFTEQGVPASVAFFSPSGVKFCLELVKKLSGEKLEQIKFAAIGPTTAEALQEAGVTVSCSAQKPTPQHLATAINHSLSHDL
ncbi:uroporphyrinogen-III synthase [Silurus meridionalis]|nr:uroporphyrinogen-III synthase [Silurus meridionalis]